MNRTDRVLFLVFLGLAILAVLLCRMPEPIRETETFDECIAKVEEMGYIESRQARTYCARYKPAK